MSMCVMPGAFDENSGVVSGTRDYSYGEHLKSDEKY